MREKDVSNFENVRALDEVGKKHDKFPRVLEHDIKNMTDVRAVDNSNLDRFKIIYPGMANREVLNAFREMRTKLYQLTGKENSAIMVSSVCENGGNSFTSINLGSAISLDRGKTSIIVDCNLGYPYLHKLLTHQPDCGLADYVEDDSVHVEEIIYASGIPRLRIIPAGNAHELGLELFNTGRMRKLIDEIRTRYPDRYIILDAPPITTSADARILQELCDYCILVIPYGKVTKDRILSAIESVDKERLVGLIFNDF